VRVYFIFFITLVPLLVNGAVVKELHFKTHGKFEDAKLCDSLGVKTRAWYQFWKDKTPKINAKLIPSFEDSLEHFYKSEGFYHVNIQKDETNSSVTFKVDEGKNVIISSIKITGDDELKKFITYKVGDRFRALEFTQNKKDIKNKLLNKGYCNYQLKSKARVDIEKDIVNIIYDLHKNPPCEFGKITISTPKNINKKIILSRLLFKEGDRYSLEKINRTYHMISGLEAFDGVELNFDQQNDKINTGISLIERSKKTRIEMGLGYETDIGPRGVLHYERRNFAGNAKKISLDFKYSNKEKFIKNSLYWPAFIKVPFKGYHYLDLKNEFGYSKIEFDNFDEKKLSNSLHLIKDYDWYSVDFGIGYERINIKKPMDTCSVSSQDFNPNSPLENLNKNYNLLFPFAKLHIDLRDSKINPKNGFYFSQFLETGVDILSNSSTYLKALTEARAIKTIGLFTYAIKGRVGVIKEYANHLPESKLFFAGGAFSNRGYSYNTIGASNSKCKNSGGKTLVDTSIEINHPVYKKFDAALFFDSTLISKNPLEFSLDFRHSIGTGIRYNSAIGPVKLDVGMDIERHSQYAISFQIGQSFWS